jgi:hypothetical protein
MSANFDSTDWIDDATDILERSNFQYVLLTGLNPDQTRIDGNIDPTPENEEALIEAIRDHFEELRKEDA